MHGAKGGNPEHEHHQSLHDHSADRCSAQGGVHQECDAHELRDRTDDDPGTAVRNPSLDRPHPEPPRTGHDQQRDVPRPRRRS